MDEHRTAHDVTLEQVEPADQVEPVGSVEAVAPPVRRSRTWIAAAAIGALVGAGVSGGIVAAVDDDDSPAGGGGGATRAARIVTEPGDIQQILRAVEPAVVAINTRGFTRDLFGGVDVSEGAGTGVVLTGDGLVLTNAHVIAGASTLKVKFTDGTERDATVVGAEPASDIALVRVTGASGLTAASLGRSAELRVGDAVVAIGNALALPGGPTVTTGIVSALERDIDTDSGTLEGLIQTDAAISRGNSGGPLVDNRGQVVGINTAVATQGQNIGFAIAIDRIKPLIDQLRTGSRAPQAFLGVTSATVDEAVRERFDLGVGAGALVTEVSPGSAAENAGIRPGDVITSIAGRDVDSADDLIAEIRRHRAGERIQVVVDRSGERRTLDVTLGQRPAGAG